MTTPEEFVKNCTKLFSLPEVYLEVKRVIDHPESTMANLSRAISIDPGMTAIILKLVNSAFYGMIFPQDIGHRVKNPIMIRNEVEDETITQASQSGI